MTQETVVDTTPRVWVALRVKSHTAVIVGLRGPTSNNPDHWNLFGGRIDAGETPYEAARRELFEETGLDLKFKRKHFAFSTLHKGRVCVWLEKKVDAHELRNAKFSAEITDYDFATKDWLDQNDLHYSLKKYLQFKHFGAYNVD